MTQTVIHDRYHKWYTERPYDDFGFSSRAAYAIGYDKPHYPVPAIPIEVAYFDWAIAICEMNDPQYKYGIITLYPNY